MHTDVPEFRGVNRKRDPQWLLVVMHHSGLFERWRMPIATGVAWFERLPRAASSPSTPTGPRARRSRSRCATTPAILLDTDRVFHGVDRVAEARAPIPTCGPACELVFAGDGRWRVELDGEARRALSLGRAALLGLVEGVLLRRRGRGARLVREHADDLTRDAGPRRRLVDDLRRARPLGEAPARTRELALTLIERVHPLPAAGARRGSRRAPSALARGLRLRSGLPRTPRRPPRRGRAAVARSISASSSIPPRARRYRGEVEIAHHARTRDTRGCACTRSICASRARSLEAGGASRSARGRAPRARLGMLELRVSAARFPPARRRLRLAFAGRLRRHLRGLYAAALGRASLRLHAVRGGRRAPDLPVLRRAGVQGALPRRGDRARRRHRCSRTRRSSAEQRLPRRPADACTSPRRRRSRPIWSRSRSGRSRRSRRARRRPDADPCVARARARGISPASRSRPAREALARLEEYFGIPYPYAKLDLVAVPDFEAGAMENAGAVFFRETLLLLDPATASLAERKRAAEVIAHELAHMWYGDLVTMAWWDDLWLNEAFATWMAYRVVDDWKPGVADVAGLRARSRRRARARRARQHASDLRARCGASPRRPRTSTSSRTRRARRWCA